MLFSVLILFGCKKESINDIAPKSKTFVRGQKLANGIVIDVMTINDNALNTPMQNFKMSIIGLNDYTDLTFTESIDKIPTLKDEFGEWNIHSLYQGGFNYTIDLGDSLIKNGGSPITKNITYWFNDLIDRTRGGIFFFNSTWNITQSSISSLSQKNRIRPTRYYSYYNTKIKSYKIGDEYMYGSLVFSIDSINRKAKVFRLSNSGTFSWNEATINIKNKVYDGEYGFRLPTVDEMTQLQNLFPTRNFGCWTSENDPINSSNALVYNSLYMFNGVPRQISSWDKSNSNNASYQLLGIKEISY